MKKLLVTLMLLLSLCCPCFGVSEQEAVTIVVNDLRIDLLESTAWIDWDRLYYEYFTVYELRPYTGYF